ncbi:CoA transferase [Streptomyces sp. MP131-18]|uniref:CoA transferase n=1 Tax=Streptomyces sp. MP131-18 TaxID=1857892 RepID=UPI00097BE529|nr:CoA transferase [Streptomyces sp. MP131-18]ONK09660.1 Succinyl-CoA:(R)-benzylsuccinate CoA-transferasesubunit BbsF [Streptomyces sp. MP131-18]
MGILDGYRVVDLSVTGAGPPPAARLGDLGADVVTVEQRPERPDDAGDGRARAAGSTAAITLPARGKLSLTVNLATARGRSVVLALARDADVLLQDYLPGVAERLGVDYPTIRRANPGIVYVSVSGQGPAGPRADDALTADSALEGTLAALLHRERTGEGRLVSVTAGRPARTPEPPGRTRGRAPYRVFATKDGHLALAMPPLESLGDALGLPELGGRGTGGHNCRDEITALVRLRLPRRTTAEWLDLFAKHGVEAGPAAPDSGNGTASRTRHDGSRAGPGGPGHRVWPLLAEDSLGVRGEAS